jgi:hypothetical protein
MSTHLDLGVVPEAPHAAEKPSLELREPRRIELEHHAADVRLLQKGQDRLSLWVREVG